MRRAVLLYNPVAGTGAAQRLLTIERAAQALQNHGVEVELVATTAPGSAGSQAAEACERGADTIFACGGDGTVHDVLQGMVNQPHAALGVLPTGTANAMARHLRLSLNPVEAALQQLSYEPRLVPAGSIAYQTSEGEGSRYFLVMAGAGPDGMLVYKMLANGKQRLGRIMYYLHAARLFSHSRFSAFSVSGNLVSCETFSRRAVSVMTVRVGDLGGLFSSLIREGELDHPHLKISVVKAPARLSLPAWFAMSWAGLHRWNSFADTLDITEFSCSAGEDSAVQVQADGEWLGRTPMQVKLIPDAVRLLMPPLHR